MSKFKEFKQKVKDNKYKIIAGTITIAGVVYVVVSQNGKIKQLQVTNQEQQSDIDLLKHIMDGTVLASLKESLTRKLRYAEGRLANGLKDGVMTAEDEKLRREEIEYFSNELAKIFKAEEMLDRSKRD
jgi:hypothetical protein